MASNGIQRTVAAMPRAIQPSVKRQVVERMMRRSVRISVTRGRVICSEMSALSARRVFKSTVIIPSCVLQVLGQVRLCSAGKLIADKALSGHPAFADSGEINLPRVFRLPGGDPRGGRLATTKPDRPSKQWFIRRSGSTSGPASPGGFGSLSSLGIPPFFLRLPIASLLNARASSHNKQPLCASGNARTFEE